MSVLANRCARVASIVWMACVLGPFTMAPGSVAAGEVEHLLRASGVEGGLVVHLGCGDGRLTAALHASESYLVHGLDRDAEDVAKARRHIKSMNLYGEVSAVHWTEDRLPYVDNLVNLLVVESPEAVSEAEMMRVLAPRGVACIRKGERWTTKVKPWPRNIDEWTHYLHDASNNPVAHDSVVGPPRHIHWSAPPLWSRSHGFTPSLSGLVSAQGRVFYIMDEGLSGVADSRFDRWRLCARDAFSGILLWKRSLSDWGTLVWKGGADGPRSGNWSSPTTLPRRLVAVEDRVYVTLGYREPVSVLDAATGEVLKTFDQTEYAEEILWDDGLLIVRQREEIPDSSGHHAWSAEARRTADGGPEVPPGVIGDQRIVTIEPDTGETVWERPAERMVTLSMAACGGRVCYHNLDEIVCLDLGTGEELWRAESPAWPTRMGTAGSLVMHEDMVFFTGDYGLQALSARTGELLWTGPRVQRSSPWQPPDLLLADGLLWGGLTKQMAQCRFPRLRAPDVAPAIEGNHPGGLNPRTGEVTRRVNIGKLVSAGHHVRCYRSKATDRYLIYNKRGMEFVDISGGKDHARCDWTRGECNYGVMPANGLLYVPPHPCACYRGALRNGFFAYATGRKTPEGRESPRLEKGPACKKTEAESAEQGDWPTYRHDAERSGTTSNKVPADLAEVWRTELDGRLSAPVIANGRVFVASIDAHTVHCLDAKKGHELWSYTAGGRVDTPATIWRGLVMFGCRDGWVYALRATDGVLAWRFRAAPSARMVVDNGQIESAWPVHGSVLVKDELAYFAAGRSTKLDGGVYLYAVEPTNGEVVHRTRAYGPWPNLQKDSGHPYWTDGSEAYLLVTGSEGKYIYMAQEVFNLDLEVQEAPVTDERGLREMGLHLAPMSDFTDDSYFHRTAWRYSRGWPGVPYAPKGPKSGQVLVFDEENTYAVRAYDEQYGHNPGFTAKQDGYVLCADDNENEAVKPRGYRIHRGKAAEWSVHIPVRVRAMVLAGDTLFLAGPPNLFPDADPYAALEGRMGCEFRAVSTKNGQELKKLKLTSPPVFDGMAAARGRLYISTEGGEVLCMGKRGPHR